MISGEEKGVPWKWTNNLLLTVAEAEGKAFGIKPHAIHGYDVAALGGNRFYGSFTILRDDGVTYHHDKYILANPTHSQHTEPQYFEWLEVELAAIILMSRFNPTAASFLQKARAFVIEMNQTNTPCSGKACRPVILEAVKSKKAAGGTWPTVVARMSAYQIYEHQYPKVMPTSFEIAHARKNAMASFALESMCVHRFPEVG